MHSEEQIQIVLDQLTPLQKDITTLVALPQLLDWSDRWASTSSRQDAVAWGLIRRGLLREVTDQPGEFEATPLGLQVAAQAYTEDGANLDIELEQAAITWLTDIS